MNSSSKTNARWRFMYESCSDFNLLMEDRTCDNSNHVKHFRWLWYPQPSTDKLLLSCYPTAPLAEHLQLILSYLTTWWALLNSDLWWLRVALSLLPPPLHSRIHHLRFPRVATNSVVSTLHHPLPQIVLVENAVFSVTQPRESQQPSDCHPNLVHQVVSAHEVTTDSIAMAIDSSRVVVVWIWISREWWWIMKIVLWTQVATIRMPATLWKIALCGSWVPILLTIFFTSGCSAPERWSAIIY